MSKGKGRRPNIPADIKTKLWLSSGGRCQFEGCNQALWRDDLTYIKMNRSYIAHIYGFAEGSARYDKVLSPKLEKDFSNLMLLCDTHHRLIDNNKTAGDFSPERLIKMKAEHEGRVEYLTGITIDKRSHVVLFGAKIGIHGSPLHTSRVNEALLPSFYPAMPSPIELGLANSSFEDSKGNYWNIQLENLEDQFFQKLGSIKEKHEVQHFSIFGLAPQPLLIKLGVLLSDIYPAEVYQLHREPNTWKWLEESTEIEYKVCKSKGTGSIVALKFELSATITNDRIEDVLGKGVDIWSVYIEKPHNDYIRNRVNLQDFRKTMRSVFDLIKAQHGQNAQLHVFPAMPVSAAIELGRIWMPKADLPMVIYDQNNKLGGFKEAILVKH